MGEGSKRGRAYSRFYVIAIGSNFYKTMRKKIDSIYIIAANTGCPHLYIRI